LENLSLKMKRLCSLALGVVFLSCTLPSGVSAHTSSADTDKRIADIEKQLDALRAELEALKSKPATVASTSPAPTPITVPAASVVTPDVPAASTPSPLAGISSVLGGVNLTGLADVYYGYNANHPATGTVTEPFQLYNSQFGLNLIELQLDKVPDRTSSLGFRVALGFGQTINAINGNPGDGALSGTQHLKEGYLSYFAPLGKSLQIDAGKFVTPAGAEVIETNQNWNYSRSLLFYYAIPYYHFGVRAKYSFNDKWSIAGYAVNGWNNTVDNNSGKTGGVSIAWNATKKLAITQNYLSGPEPVGTVSSWRNLSDTVVAYNPTTKLSFIANVDYGRQQKLSSTQTPADWSGIAGYVKYAFNPKVALAGRYEYFNDHDGFDTGKPQHMNGFTGTFERRIADHLLSRMEVRHDSSNQDFFQRGNSSFVKGQTTVDAGLVFVLEPNDTK
jgi:hypothetical protein